jgi:hypothetical protein
MGKSQEELEMFDWAHMCWRPAKDILLGKPMASSPACQAEPAQVAEESGWQDRLQELGIKTDKAVKTFQRAIDRGIMQEADSGLVWPYSSTLLAYFCGLIYCGDVVRPRGWVKVGTFPNKELCAFFGLRNLGQLRLGTDKPPKGHEIVDGLLE